MRLLLGLTILVAVAGLASAQDATAGGKQPAPLSPENCLFGRFDGRVSGVTGVVRVCGDALREQVALVDAWISTPVDGKLGLCDESKCVNEADAPGLTFVQRREKDGDYTCLRFMLGWQGLAPMRAVFTDADPPEPAVEWTRLTSRVPTLLERDLRQRCLG